ncbi:MAG: hypothetical protein Kow001_07500 [Acidobacteriota bacterium]
MHRFTEEAGPGIELEYRVVLLHRVRDTGALRLPGFNLMQVSGRDERAARKERVPEPGNRQQAADSQG